MSILLDGSEVPIATIAREAGMTAGLVARFFELPGTEQLPYGVWCLCATRLKANCPAVARWLEA